MNQLLEMLKRTPTMYSPYQVQSIIQFVYLRILFLATKEFVRKLKFLSKPEILKFKDQFFVASRNFVKNKNFCKIKSYVKIKNFLLKRVIVIKAGNIPQNLKLSKSNFLLLKFAIFLKIFVFKIRNFS